MVRLPQNEKQTHRLNSRPHMWPSGLTLAMTLTLNFQGQIWNLLYLTKSGPIATKQIANISIELPASNVTNGFDLGHDLDIWIFKVKCDLDHLVTKVRCKDLPNSDRGDFRCRRAVDSSSLARKISQFMDTFTMASCDSSTSLIYVIVDLATYLDSNQECSYYYVHHGTDPWWWPQGQRAGSVCTLVAPVPADIVFSSVRYDYKVWAPLFLYIGKTCALWLTNKQFWIWIWIWYIWHYLPHGLPWQWYHMSVMAS